MNETTNNSINHDKNQWFLPAKDKLPKNNADNDLTVSCNNNQWL